MSDTDNAKTHDIFWRIKQWFPNLSTTSYDNLKKYHDELIKFNKNLNLISPKTVAVADNVHFADSILSFNIVKEKVNENEYLYDIGSGNGFPGLIYAILSPSQKMILVDSDERKCEFLKHIIASCKLNNAAVLNKKIESVGENIISQAVCRGYAPLPFALLTLRKLTSLNGKIFHLKSDEWSIEVSKIPTQLCSVWQPSLLGEYKLPASDAKMSVVCTEKIY